MSRARRIVECTVGILANKRRIFHRPIDVKPDFCDIIKACCVLHNYVRKNDGIQFDDTLYECPLERIEPVGTRGSVRWRYCCQSISQSISLRHKGQFPGSMVKCNNCFMSARTFFHGNKLVVSQNIFSCVIKMFLRFLFKV